MAYKIVGVTYDGVKIIAPKTKSKKFTRKEIRLAIQRAKDTTKTNGESR